VKRFTLTVSACSSKVSRGQKRLLYGQIDCLVPARFVNLDDPAFERSGLTSIPAIDFALPLREQDSADLDERIYGPFESRLLVKAATAVGMAPEDALRGSHIKPDQLRDATTRVSARQRLALYQNIFENCRDATVFLRAGNAATVCSFGIWGYALMSSSTYLDAIHMAFKYLKLTGPLLEK
jgi:hypothetical protein